MASNLQHPTNIQGTCVNQGPLYHHPPWPPRYVELLERDVIRFGLSSREYVLLNDKSVD